MCLGLEHKEVAQYLLEKGADPDCKDKFGSTPRSEATGTDLLGKECRVEA